MGRISSTYEYISLDYISNGKSSSRKMPVQPKGGLKLDASGSQYRESFSWQSREKVGQDKTKTEKVFVFPSLFVL